MKKSLLHLPKNLYRPELVPFYRDRRSLQEGLQNHKKAVGILGGKSKSITTPDEKDLHRKDRKFCWLTPVWGQLVILIMIFKCD